MSREADWFDYAHGFSGDEGAWDQLQETHASLADLEFEIECGGEMHSAQLTQNGLRVSHSDLELEQALNALGGEAPECLRVHRAMEYLRGAQWLEKPDWTLLLKSDSEMESMMARPWGPAFGTLQGASNNEETNLLRDLMCLPHAARIRFAVSLVLQLFSHSPPLLRQRTAQVCLRLLDPNFQPDPGFLSALSIVRVMNVEQALQWE